MEDAVWHVMEVGQENQAIAAGVRGGTQAEGLEGGTRKRRRGSREKRRLPLRAKL